ncbi:MAG TPA: DUF5916 domain-containing protein, partial [Thermoanaerobaculia bacterium]|nr:DUF5916 domain-containing protein [Thermoanaerobaculia bacterium]
MRNRAFVALLLLCLAVSLAAQTPAPAPAALPPPAPLTVRRSDVAVTLDGALDDPAWQSAAVIDQFYETSPGNNVPAKVKTTAYITYDAKYFYIGVKADDPEPAKIRAPYVDRDGVIGTDDNIAIFLDTRNDKRSAMEFRVNPRGIQADGIFNDANSNEDFSPDFYYDTAAQVTSTGWSAEFRIPFSSLRYGSADPQTWNILVWRNYPRDFRYAFHSAPIARGSNCLVCFTHPLVGLTNLPDAAHLVAAPYVTAQQSSAPEAGLGTDLENGDSEFDGGVDVKWNPSANHAVDLTLNPDFSQIEADVPQILVNQRFAVFYPEKRPFFLEGFDLFDTPLQVAYTRTITDPQAGVRATGKIGNTAYTFLTTKDEGGGGTIIPGPTRSGFAFLDASSYSTIARVRHDLGRGFVGGVLTDREIDGGGHNRVIGPDFQWRLTEDTFQAQFLYSDTENPLRPQEHPAWNGEEATSHAFSASYGHRDDKYDYGVQYYDVGDEFRADLGFIPQAGYRQGLGYVGRSFYPENSKVRFVRPSVLVDYQEDRAGNVIFETLSLGVGGFGAKNTNFGVLARLGEKVRVGDELLEQNYLQVNYQFDPHRRIPRISFGLRVGEQIDFDNGREGDGLSLSVGASARPHDRLDLQFNVARDSLDVEGGRLFTAMVERVRAQYSFSNKSLVRLIGQYVTTDYNPGLYLFDVPEKDGSFLGSVLYSYKLNWQTVLFVGYGDERLLLGDERLA